jgi:hypothetical protein
MNRSELRSMVRNLLNETSAGFWTDAQLNSYINLSVQRLNSIISATREDYFTVSATFVTTPGTKSYNFPSDCNYIRRMEIYSTTDSSDIVKIDELKWPRSEAGGDWPFAQTGQPQRYTIVGTHFDLLPIPDNGYPIRVYYDARKADLSTDAQSPSSPLDYHDMIVYWDCLLAKKQNEDDDTGFASLFNARKVELIEMLINRGGEDPKIVEGHLEGVF